MNIEGPERRGHSDGWGELGSPIILLDIAVGIANICLLLVLIYIYWGSYRKVKSKFTAGLLVFAFFLLLQNLLFTGYLLLFIDFRGPNMGVPLFTVNITQFVALLSLLLITWE